MRRFTTLLLFLIVSTCVTCSLITDRVTKDIPLPDAELEENSVPEATPIEVPQPNSVTENAGCAKIGEFCINHKDCCSNACLGYMKRCVSGRELEEEEQLS
ncbi:uncharacterized protein LOC111356050 [Spodoptera litura]|uniref:Uncharacterized protein LOC111356050 n=1 Tax=Spodoptera litura TaxID=69820 RepID=A0A9J7E9W4_SPOLT|nr:uncharacterized protein LOC111356050 [Spodoptera litura]